VLYDTAGEPKESNGQVNSAFVFENIWLDRYRYYGAGGNRDGANFWEISPALRDSCGVTLSVNTCFPTLAMLAAESRRNRANYVRKTMSPWSIIRNP
jgi:hypothetical protein